MALEGAAEPSPNVFVEFDNVNSFVSTEIALSLDHILEQIFQSLNPNDLLNCRLVCHRWLNFAHKPLQAQIKLMFCENEQTNKDGYTRWSDAPCKRLAELTILLKKGQSLLDSEGNGQNTIRFPCNRFGFRCVSLSNEDLNEFLNTNGHNIHELDLDLDLDLDTVSDALVEEYLLMDKIGNLLLYQATNIKCLQLRLECCHSIEWKNKNKGPDIACLETTNPEYQEILQKASDLLQSKPSASLEVLRLSGTSFAKILEFIFRISPNLEEVQLGDGFENWVYDQMHLLEPENRLSLLKEFIFYLDVRDSRDHLNVEIMEKLSFGNFRLRSFEVFLCNDPEGWIQEYGEYLPRIVDMINRILKGSWNTLEEIILCDVTFLKGMKLPEVMPKLRKIEIWESIEFNEESNANRNMMLFPMGSNFQKSFPKLTLIKLMKNLHTKVSMGFSSLLKSLNFGADPLSTSVRRVHLSSGRSKVNFLGISQIIQEWFPNALISQD